MIDKQNIILGYYRHGKSKKALSRELGISLKTIKKYLKSYEAEMTAAGKDPTALPITGIVQAPRYDSSNRKKRILTESIRSLLDGYLEQNKIKRQQGHHKQLMKMTDMHQAVLAAGHQVSYTTVRTYVNQQRARQREVYIRQHYDPGQCVEFDWAEVQLTLHDIPTKFMMAVFTSCYSNHRWVRLYHRQDMSSFLDSHSQYFAYTGVVQQQVVYDNMRTAVRKYILRNADKLPTDDLLKISCYYQFDYRFCNARKGNEKGHVERSVEYIRRKAFARQDQFDNLEAANEYLLNICKQVNQQPLSGKTTPIEAQFQHEAQYMKTAPPPYDTAQLTTLRVDKYSCIKVDTNWYSVQEGHVGQMIKVKIYPNKILAYNAENQLISSHPRARASYQYFVQIHHYLHTLHTKPGALKGALTLQQADEKLRAIFFDHFEQRPKEFVELLLFIRKKQYPIAQLYQAIEQCLELCPHQLPDLDKIKILLLPKATTEEAPVLARDSVSQQIAQQCTDMLENIQSHFHFTS